VGLERGPLSLVRTTEELLELESSGSESRKPRLTAVGIRCADHAAPSINGDYLLVILCVTQYVCFLPAFSRNYLSNNVKETQNDSSSKSKVKFSPYNTKKIFKHIVK
jgi:hypothetical protein